MSFLYVVSPSGRVGHIVADVVSGGDTRTVVTVCGKSYDEYELTTNTDEENACSTCSGKVDKAVESTVESTPEAPVEKEAPKATATKSTTSSDK